MSVNYLIEINALDEWELTHPLSETAYKLMRKLQYLANKERFPRMISVPNAMLIAMVGCSKDSLIRARNELIQDGLIRYKGQKRVTPQYEILYFSNRLAGDKSDSATYPTALPAAYSATIPATYPATIYINKTRLKSDEEADADNSGRAREPAVLPAARSPEDERHLRGIAAFLQQLSATPYADLFSRAEPMQQMLGTDRFPIALVGEALEATLSRHCRYPLIDGASYALQLLVDWTSRGITTPEELRESRDNYD